MALRDHTEAPFLRPNDCSAHTESRSLYDRTTAVRACNDSDIPGTVTSPVEA
jgi:hypothetical protein